MKNNWVMLALLLGGLFLLRNRTMPTEAQRMARGETNVPGIPGTSGMYGEG